MSEFIIENTSVQIVSSLTLSPKIRSMVTDYIRARLQRPVVAWPDNALGKHAIRFASEKDVKDVLPNANFLNVTLDNGFSGRIYTLNGLKPEDITQDDIDYAAKYLWFEPIFVAAWNDGTPYIDD